jgi:hypothetical protein
MARRQSLWPGLSEFDCAFDTYLHSQPACATLDQTRNAGRSDSAQKSICYSPNTLVCSKAVCCCLRRERVAWLANDKLCVQTWRSARQNCKLRSAVHCASRGYYSHTSLYTVCPHVTARSDTSERLRVWLRPQSWLGPTPAPRSQVSGSRPTRARQPPPPRSASVVRWQLQW